MENQLHGMTGMQPWMYIAVFGISFLGYFIKGVAGFGDPLVTNPLLSLFMENRVISPGGLLMGAPINGYIVWKNRRSFSLRVVLPVSACILIGIIPGTLLLKYGEALWLKVGLGVLILVIGAEMITRDRAKPVKANPLVMAIVCFCSGLTAGIYGINLFFVAYIERTTTERGEFRGNMCFVFLVENIFRIAVYAVAGVFTREVLTLFLALIPGMVLGLLIGSRVDKRLSDTAVRRLVNVLFLLGGASVLIRALIWGA